MEVWVVGHKAPDTDSICSAIAYAEFCNLLKKYEAIPRRAGEINKETKFVLEKFGFEVPELLEDCSGKNLILVDHNEFSQAINGIEKANILGIIDHHKFNFSYPKPIYILCEPLGSTATIIAKKFFSKSVEVSEDIAGILLSAILSDTVIFKSSTTTEEDIRIAKKLNEVLGIDMMEFGIEMKKVGSEIKDLSNREIILKDFKEFDFKGKKVGIAQVELVDISDLKSKKAELLKEMEKIMEERGYYGLVFMITDIIKEGSLMLCLGCEKEFEKAFEKKLEDGSVWLPNVMSRKKDVVPKLMEAF